MNIRRFGFVVLTTSMITLAACGGGNKASKEPPTIVAGRVVKGVVTVYVINAAGERQHAIGRARTDDSGHFSLELQERPATPVAVVTADDATAMTCDYQRRLRRIRRGTAAAFGDRVRLSAGFELKALIPVIKADEPNRANLVWAVRSMSTRPSMAWPISRRRRLYRHSNGR